MYVTSLPIVLNQNNEVVPNAKGIVNLVSFSNQMHEIDCDTEDTFEIPDDLMQDFVIESVEISNAQNEIHVTAQVFNKSPELKIDSGAKCNVISLETLKALDISSKLTVLEKLT